MATKVLYFRKEDASKAGRYFVFDTEAELLSDTLIPGDFAFCIDTRNSFTAISATEWAQTGGGTVDAGLLIDGGPSDATYLPGQFIDGGQANSLYTPSQQISGGSA